MSEYEMELTETTIMYLKDESINPYRYVLLLDVGLRMPTSSGTVVTGWGGGVATGCQDMRPPALGTRPQ